MARRKIGLVGAAVSDHPAIRDLCRKILAAGGTLGISSLRADSADAELLQLLAQGGVRSVALAPEAGSDRLRRVINKGLTRDDLARAAVDVSRAGIRQLRLYFMVGLPTETMDDVAEIPRLAKFLEHSVIKESLGKKHLGLITLIEWTSVPKTAEQWRHIHRKVTGVSRAAGFTDWYYDMGQYFNDPEVHAEIGAQRTVAEKLLKTPRSAFRPDVCVVVTPNDRPYLTHDEAVIPYDEVNFNPQGLAMAASGVPFEQHYLNDILARPALQDFKVYVFLQNAFLTQAQCAAIREKLQNRNRTFVWVYNSGYVSEAGKSVAAMSELIGIRLATEEKTARRTMLLDPPCRPFVGGAEMYFTIFNWGAPGVQPFWVEDETATPLARYAETRQVAGAGSSRPAGSASTSAPRRA